MIFYTPLEDIESKKYLLEDADDNTEDNNEDQGNNNNDEGGGNDDGGDEGGGDNPEDFDMPNEGGGGEDGGEEGEEGEGGDEEGGEDDMGGDEGGGEDMGNEGDDPLKNIESEIFANMSSEQLAIKNKELKTRFYNMYTYIQDIMDRLNDVPKTIAIIKPLSFISRKLDYTANMIVDYITNTFDTLGYIENEINYNKYYSILVGIDNLFKEIIINNKMDDPKPKDIRTEDIPVGV